MLLLMKRNGKAVPALDNEPKPDPLLSWYHQAFWRLSGSRQGRNKLTIESMHAYIGMSGCISTTGDFIDVMQSMDAKFLELMAK